MKFRTQTISLCYNPPAVIEASIDQFYATTVVETQHLLVDQCWPLEREAMEAVFQRLSQKYGCEVLRPGKNLGLARGFNWALSERPFPRNGMVIGYDPDSWPVTFAWDHAMCEEFVRRPDTAWFSLWHPHAERELLQERRGTVDPSNPFIVTATSAVMNSVCGFRRGWLEDCGGLYEANNFYGGLESHMWQRLVDHKMKWIFLRDFHEDFWPKPELLDTRYRDYKWLTTHGGEKQVEFPEWLKLKGYL